RRDRLLLDPAANDEKFALELLLARPLGVPDHDLLDLGPRRVVLLSDAGVVDRHLPPAIDRIAEIQDLGLDDLPAALLRAKCGLGQELLADRDRAGLPLVAAALHDLGEEIL